VGGILELILFVTSAGAIYLCLALAHQEVTVRGKKGASWVHSVPRCIQLNSNWLRIGIVTYWGVGGFDC
jgi:hypothetical protein